MRIDLRSDVTVFVTTCNNNPNYAACLAALAKQTVDFQLVILRKVSPLSAAFQRMIDTCQTRFYVQCDEDMVLYLNAIERLYTKISKTDRDKIAFCYALLFDPHLNREIEGIRINRHRLIKNYPFKHNCISCELDQSNRLLADGLSFEMMSEVVGQHSPEWSPELIFMRYLNICQKRRALDLDLGYNNLLEVLSKKVAEQKSPVNVAALAGALIGKFGHRCDNVEKDFNQYSQHFKKAGDILPMINETYKPVKVLYAYDVPGWVFYFEAKAYEKYSALNITPIQGPKIKDSDLDGVSLVILPGSCMYKSLKDTGIIDKIKNRNIPIAVQYNSEIELDLKRPLVVADYLLASSPKIYQRLISMSGLGVENVYFMPRCVDTEKFYPENKANNFSIGWAGNPTCEVKRYELLDTLKYPVVVKANYGDKYFVERDNAKEMRGFYNSLDVYLMLSATEGSPMTVLEAMACGTAVLATDTGIVPLILPSEWIIPNCGDITARVNAKLDYLKMHPEEVKAAGLRNREFVLENMSWLAGVQKFDKVCTDIASKTATADTFTSTYKHLAIKSRPKIKLAQVYTVPCANSGYNISKLLNSKSRLFESRSIMCQEYSKTIRDIPYRKFPYDLLWSENEDEALQVLRDADIIHIHHKFITDNPKVQEAIKGKLVIATVYDLSLQNNKKYIEQLKSEAVVTLPDQPEQRKVFGGISSIFIPLVNNLERISGKVANKVPVIAYAPTNRFPITHNSSKGYAEVLGVLSRLADEGYSFDVDIIEGVPYEENIKRKSNADIVIDDVVHETFHNTSLEAACFGAVPITGYSGADYPFTKASLKTLHDVLADLLSSADKLSVAQQAIMSWANRDYSEYKLLEYYEKFYKRMMVYSHIPQAIEASAVQVVEPSPVVKPEPVVKVPAADPLAAVRSDKAELVSRLLAAATAAGTPILFEKSSCLYAIKGGNLPEACKDIYIALHAKPKFFEELTKRDILGNNSVRTFRQLTVFIGPNRHRLTKDASLCGSSVKIPFPAIDYLDKVYGRNWRNIA